MTVFSEGKFFNQIDMAETLRYLGYGRKDIPPEETQTLLDECQREILSAQDLKAVYEIYPLKADGDDLDLGFAKLKSHALSLNLKGFDKVLLFVATAGQGVDRLIVKYSRISPAKSAVFQAMGASLVESWCDEICKRIRAEYNANTSRFSCGFGDCPLSLQKDIFTALDVTKRIGITLSKDFFMTPTKSVSAMVGIKTK
ncbi:MAG: vitamin B12 dependent-methionine synthase activation domain-containing protein [Candidatus Coproplasma sp.]